jgi:aspartyl-tRNA(Asn)/glutamyl-tRNA(Gln) amidotransferase subunit C
MSRVTSETVEHVARLARLLLTPEERDTFARQLEGILAYAASLDAVDTSAVEPMSHALSPESLRDDVAAGGLRRETAMEAAPDAADGLFRVPRVLESKANEGKG